MTIWKFPLAITGYQTVDMPGGAKLLHVGPQDGWLYLWAVVRPKAVERVQRRIRIIGTGYFVSSHETFNYIGTAIMPPFVWHVFDLGEA